MQRPNRGAPAAIPSQFQNFLNELIATFGPPLSVILALLFRPDTTDRTASAGIRAKTAFALSALYNLAFDLISLVFGTERINASEAIDMMRANRTLFTLVISGVLTCYFAVGR